MFDAEQIIALRGLASFADGARARVAGIVLVRQRPGEGTAIFITLSDETGVCQSGGMGEHLPRFRKEVMGARLLLAEGKVQKSPEGVLHSDGGEADRPQRRSQPSASGETPLPPHPA